MIRAGWTTFPIRAFDPESKACSCGRAECLDAGKHPAVRWGKDHLAAGTQLPVPPGCGVGIATGERSGVVIVDVDQKDGRDGWSNLVKLGPIPPTLTATTPTGGIHLYYRWPGGFVMTNSNVLAEGVDVRGDGGYAVLPPSPHKRGGNYAWVDPDAPIVDAPPWLLEKFRQWNDERERRHQVTPAPALEGDYAGLSLDERKRRAAEYLRARPGAKEGRINAGERYTGGTQTFVHMSTLVRGYALSPEVALDVAEEWNQRCEPPWDAPGLRRKLMEAYERGDMKWGSMLPRVKGVTEGFFALTADDLLAPVPPPRYHVPELGVVCGRPTQMVGMGFSGKTILAQDACVSTIAPGALLWGRFEVAHGPAGWLDFEMGRLPLLRRFRRIAAAKGIPWEVVARDLHLCPLPKTKLSSDDAEEHLVRFADGLTACFVDSLRRSTPGVEENDSTIADYIDQLLRVSEVTGCTFWFLHHATTKTKYVEGQDARGHGRGSSAIFDSSGTVLAVSGPAGEPMAVHQTRSGEGSAGVKPFTLAIEDVDVEGAFRDELVMVGANGATVDLRQGLRVVFSERIGEEERDIATAILDAVKGYNFRGEAVCSNDELVRAVKMRKNDVVAVKAQLIDQGRLLNLGTPARPRYWVANEEGRPWVPEKDQGT